MVSQQPNLFGSPNSYGEFEPLARTSDPLTSHRAAAKQVGARADSQAAVIVSILRRAARPLTFREIWASANYEDQKRLREAVTIARRLTTMERRGLVRPGPERPCSVSGSSARVWELTELAG